MKGVKVGFLITAFIDILRNLSEGTPDEIDLIYVVVALVCSFVGSSVQITHKTLRRVVHNKEIVAVYVTGIMISIMAYFVGVQTEKVMYVALIAVFASYMSLDLFAGLKKAILAIVAILPDAFRQYIKYKMGLKDDDKKKIKTRRYGFNVIDGLKHIF